jgi:ATP-dependent Lhr-like helicase
MNDHARLVRSAERRLRRQLERGRERAAEPASPPTTIETVAAPAARGDGASRVEAWFAHRGMQPFSFQRETWARYAAGESGLIHASTGTGKTLAAWLGPVMEAIDENGGTNALQVLWITPMRALAADTLRALAAPLGDLGLSWRIGLRTGDTSPADRARQDRRRLHAIVTTPESLTLMLTRAEQGATFGRLRAVVVDEWHELMSTKRGVQVELALARLKRLAPKLRIWGLSATLGNLEEARDVLLGNAQGAMVAGSEPKSIVIDAILPEDIRRYPWAGHLGTRAVAQVAAEIEASTTTLVFTNVRSQAEQWYRALLEHRPDWAGVIGLHHASLDVSARRWVENGLRDGTLKAAVCTSSLDLGVDFSPVDRVIQVGSPKGVARLLQRAGRSGHRPNAASRITCVPGHALELIETPAVRNAVAARAIEARPPLDTPLDVLVQHVITIALGEGFRGDELLEEVRSAHAYSTLTDVEWDWVLAFAGGGGVLSAYPEYRRITADDAGIYRVPDARVARRHRAQVGTIVSDASVNVQFMRGGRIGTVEESFLAKLQPGEAFLMGGRAVEFVRMREMTAWVRRASSGSAIVPRWLGGKLSLTSELARHIQRELERAGDSVRDAQSGETLPMETATLMPLIALQARNSRVPRSDEVLAEVHHTREGMHLCLFPFAGRHVNAALAALVAWRLAREAPLSFSMGFNDYGFELLSPVAFDMVRHGPGEARRGARRGQRSRRYRRERQCRRARAPALP